MTVSSITVYSGSDGIDRQLRVEVIGRARANDTVRIQQYKTGMSLELTTGEAIALSEALKKIGAGYYAT